MNDNRYRALVVDVGRILLRYIGDAENVDFLHITYGDLAKRLPYEFNPINPDCVVNIDII